VKGEDVVVSVPHEAEYHQGIWGMEV